MNFLNVKLGLLSLLASFILFSGSIAAQSLSDLTAGGEYYIDHIGSDRRLKSNGADNDLMLVNNTDTGIRSHWKFINAGNGYVYIQCVANDTRIQGFSSALNDESAVELGANSFAGPWVQWELVSAGNGNWFLENRGHNTRLNVTGNAEIAFGDIGWDGPWVQWKITNRSGGGTFSLSNFTPNNTNNPTNTAKLGSNAEVKLNFSKAVNLATSNTIDVYINKNLANNNCSWSLGSSNQLKVKHNTSWSPGSLVTIKIKSTTKSVSGSSFSGRKEYGFIVDTPKNFGREPTITIPPIPNVNNGTHQLPLKLNLPANRTNKVPVHIWVHGGGWKDPISVPPASTAAESPHGKYLAEELGIATLGIAYRTLDENGTFAKAMNDIESAYQWAVNNAGTYNFDVDKIFISGGSAGTPLAALFAQRQSNIKAFIGFNGVYDFVNSPSNEFPRPGVAAYQHCNPSCSANSARFNLRNNPPTTLLLHGNADTEISHNQSIWFRDAVNAKGGSADTTIYRGEEHAFFNFGRVQYEDCLWEMARFLKNNNLCQLSPPVQNGDEFYIEHIGTDKRLKSNGEDTDLWMVNITDTGERSRWKLIDAGNGYHYIQCVANGKRLRGTSNVLSDGSAVHLSPGNYSGDWVQWKLIPVGSNYFIQNKGHNTRLFVTDNAQVSFGSTAWNGPHVQWRIANTVTNVSFKESTEFEVQNFDMYPNPAKAGTNIYFDYAADSADESIEMHILNTSGQQLISKEISPEEGLKSYQVNAHELSSGFYFVRLVIHKQNGIYRKVGKIIIH